MLNDPLERRLSSAAAARTSNVKASTATAPAPASRLSRLTSLCGSWKLISAWTRSTASNAASTAASARTQGATATSAEVPSSGRARRTRAPRKTDAGALAPTAAIGQQDPLDALGDVLRGERGARDVADVLTDRQRAARGLADELREPARTANLAAIRLAIFQDIDPADTAAGIDGHRVVDVEVLSD